MIGSLKGIVVEKYGDAVILEVQGVGYELLLPVEDWGSAKVGGTARFYIYEQIREDAHNLFGFASLEAKNFFLLLLSVNGVGPKVALAVLSATSIDRLKQAIASGDPELLKGVSGVGKKTAERIVMELRSKIGEVGGGLSMVSAHDSTYQALVGLGYTAAQASQAVAAIDPAITDEQERIRAALRGLK